VRDDQGQLLRFALHSYENQQHDEINQHLFVKDILICERYKASSQP